MERDRKFMVLLSALVALVGCGEGASSPGTGGDGAGARGGAGGAAGSGGVGGDGGSGGDLGTAALEPLDAPPRYSVVSSDFSSTSIAMLDEEFEPIAESWVNSGTTYPGLVATLSGDVVLPTRQADDGTFTVIDRFLTDVVTRFFVPSGNLVGQVRIQGETGDSGFSSNPQDVIHVDSQSAWVPRYESNLDPGAAPENQGNDLYQIDPTDMTATGIRIDLSELNAMVTVGNPSMQVEALARPGRGLLFGTTLLIGLDRISAAFDAAAPGMVGLVNLSDESVEGIELTGLQSCGRVVPIPSEPTKAAVACLGFSNPFGDEAQIRASAGIAVLDVNAGEATVDRIWRVADDPDSAIAVNAIIALSAERVLAVANGNFADTTDVLYEVDLLSGAQAPVLVSEGTFTIGTAAYDPDRGMLYVPDAAANAVIELAETDDGFTYVGSTEIAPGIGLPPTQVYLLN